MRPARRELCHSAGPFANKTAFREAQEGGAEITYGELDAQSDRMIGFFTDHGLRREDRVAMLVLDEIAYPVAFFGALKSGVVPILLNTLLATPVYMLATTIGQALFNPAWQRVYRLLGYAVIGGAVLAGLPLWD